MPEFADTTLWWLAVRALAVGALLLLLGGLLRRAMRVDSAHSLPATTPTVAERWFLQLALGLSGVAWLAVLLAEFGRFTLGWLFGLLVASCVGLRLIIGPGSRDPSDGGRSTDLLVMGALCLLAVSLFLPPYQTALWASDSTAYLNFGRQIGENGAFVFEDNFLASLEPDTRRSLFLNTTISDVTGTYARFPGGFLIPDVADPRVTAGFSPLFPALLALFYLLFGLEGAFFVGPIFATFSVCGLYLLGARLSGRTTGMLAATLLAVSASQIWFAKFPLPAVVSQFFILAGLLALLVSLAQGGRRLAFGAGWLLGVAVLGKFDLVAVLPVAALAVLVGAGLTRAMAGDVGRWSMAFCVIAGLAIPLLHTAAHFLAFPSHYAPFLARMVQLSRLGPLLIPLAGVGVLAGLLALLAIRGPGRAWLSHPRWRERGAAAVGLVLLIGYAAGYVNASENRLAETTAWLEWYLSWPVLGLAAIGLGSALWAWWRGRPNVGLLMVLALLVVAGGHYLYDPHEATELIWSLRRFVPVVIPGLLLAASLAATDLLAALPVAFPRGVRAVATAAVCGCLLFLVGRPAAATFGEQLWGDGLATSRRVAEQFSADAVVLVGSELAGLHLQTSLAYLHDLDTLFLQPLARDPQMLETEVLTWLRSGRPVFAVVAPHAPLFFAPKLLGTAHADIEVELSALETTVARRPTAVVRRRAPLQVIRLADRGQTRMASLDVGVPAEDSLSEPRGFYDSERDSGQSDGTYRWTSAVATFRMPWEDAFELVVSGGRPEGEPLAEISILIEGSVAAQVGEVPNAPTRITVENPVSEREQGVHVTIRSTVFNPAGRGMSDDQRDLGVRLYRVDLRRRSDPSDSEIGPDRRGR